MRTNRRATQRKLIKTGEAAGIPGDLRRRLGLWVASRRHEVGMTQKEMAAKLGVEDANGLSAIENGRANIPIERYTAYAKSLEMSQADFAKVVLRHTDPWIYRAVYNSREQALLDELALIEKSVENRGTQKDDLK